MATSKPTVASTTFAVDTVTPGEKLLPTVKAYVAIENLLRSRIEACDSYHTDVVSQPGYHSLIAAADIAYQHHFPFVLSPDVVWLTLAQGLAFHVNNNAEKLRSRIVSHQDKKTIRVQRDDFVKGSPENPWPEVWPEFGDQIKESLVPQIHELILNDFTTTTPTDRVASEVVLMDCVQSYFSYEFVTMCGIPQITLEGTVDDWERIHRRVEQLDEFDLKWWTKDLRQITAEFVSSAKGNPNREFWQAIYKQEDSSGGPYISGWLVRFLPYLNSRKDEFVRVENGRCKYRTDFRTDTKNPYAGKPLLAKPTPFGGVVDSQLPSSASSVPFVWEYRFNKYEYQFVAGVMTIEQDRESRAIRPRIGWAVRPASSRT